MNFVILAVFAIFAAGFLTGMALIALNLLLGIFYAGKMSILVPIVVYLVILALLWGALLMDYSRYKKSK